jgi:hypothetical protein
MEIVERVFDKDIEGAEMEPSTFLIRSRSFLIIGDLYQLYGTGGGVNIHKLRPFELYRRNLYEPEIITFDELLDGPNGILRKLSAKGAFFDS